MNQCSHLCTSLIAMPWPLVFLWNWQRCAKIPWKYYDLQPSTECFVISLTSLGGHTSVQLNTVKCWFLGPGPGSANGASMLQPPSSGTRCLHTCAQPPSVVNSDRLKIPLFTQAFLWELFFKSVYDIDIDIIKPTPTNFLRTVLCLIFAIIILVSHDPVLSVHIVQCLDLSHSFTEFLY